VLRVRSVLLAWLSLACAALAASPTVNLPPEPEEPAATPASPEAGTIPFTVAHLRGSDEVPLGLSGFQALSESLSHSLALQAALQRAGRSGIEVIGTDSHEDLIRRMNNTEFDMVFAPSLVYVRQTGDYTVLAQIRDQSLQGAGGRLGLLQTSVIFVNCTSPLFGLPPITGGQVSPAVTAQIALTPIALTSASSAVGYVYPLMTLRQEFGVTEGPRIFFRDSSEEVVLSVLNNLFAMGACDKTTLERVVREWAPGVKPEDLIRVIASVNEVPAAPVVLRSDLVGAVGPALQGAMRAFLEGQEGEPLTWEPASDRMYDSLRRVVDAFYRIRRRP
jgi:ABC-type phosphate/phosphonate transport system substrate-binding protein